LWKPTARSTPTSAASWNSSIAGNSPSYTEEVKWPAALLACALAQATELPRLVREIALDPEECYRVRDITFSKEDARLFFTDGYLIFATPLHGRRLAAVFATEVEGGDGELLLLPPALSERQSLAVHTGSPNLNEHFGTSVLVFSDDSDRQLLALIAENPSNRKTPDVGQALAEKFTPTLRNIVSSYESRLLLDLFTNDPQTLGFFTGAMSGKALGNFDLWYDPRSHEQMTVGQLAMRDGRSYFNVWTRFQARSFRTRQRPLPSPEMTLRNYRIDAQVNADLSLQVTTRVTATPGQPARNVLPFEMSSSMRILSAAIDGEPATVVQRDSVRSNLIRNTGAELVLVIPAQPLIAGRQYEIELRTEGNVIHDAGNQVYYVGARATWYPGRGLQFATYDLTFRYPKSLRLVTPGEVVEERTDGDWQVTRRRTPPIRMAGFNLGDYEHTRVNRAGYTVDVYANRTLERALQPRITAPAIVLPPAPPWTRNRRPDIIRLPSEPPPVNPKARLQDLAGEIASALEFMAARFGPPAVGLLNVSPVPGRFGQGFPGLIYLSTLSYLGPQSKAVATLDDRQITFFTEILHAHETAHQWWGNVVTADGYRDDWILEALANYSALLYLERRKGARSMEATLQEYRGQLLATNDGGQTIESAGPIVLGPRLESSQTPTSWRHITYGKGSWILHMLRRRMGDERFFSMLGALRKRFEFKTITTDEFRVLAAGFLPPKSPDTKLESFFEQWVYGTGIPELQLKHAVKGKAPQLRLTGTLAQKGVDSDYTAEVPVELQFRRGKPQIVWLPASSEAVEFNIRVREAPSRVVLNPGLAVLAKN
jgi:hypothetical protein